jgi:lysophospholipase L1-like esterase
MSAGVVAIVVLSYLALHRPPPPGFAAPAAGTGTTQRSGTTQPSGTTQASGTTRPAATTQPTKATSPEPITMLVIGDSYTAGGSAGGARESGWPQLVAKDLTAAGRPVSLEVAAAGGSGYVTTGPKNVTFVQLAQRTGRNRDLVVFFGSRNDVAAAPDVQAAAEAAFATVRAASPEAVILAIGPPWVNGNPPGYIVTDRDAVHAAAQAAGVGFVDPLAEGWFTGDAAAFIGPDGIHPTDQGHRYLADLIRPRIESVLPHGP